MCIENNLLVTAGYCWLFSFILFYYFHQWKYTKINYVRDQDTQNDGALLSQGTRKCAGLRAFLRVLFQLPCFYKWGSWGPEWPPSQQD